ncbi:hypothetical protein ARMA_0232 [Ardenticatena maritima]|uniref:Uncharacterized protein n=1 Tax=Ardenticatena maritima TaxID=872965 RepID=A0A0N0RF91_9CHLR|nr:hypothetical protein ARMA_0232 [Ardenticatena maritima]
MSSAGSETAFHASHMFTSILVYVISGAGCQAWRLVPQSGLTNTAKHLTSRAPAPSDESGGWYPCGSP